MKATLKIGVEAESTTVAELREGEVGKRYDGGIYLKLNRGCIFFYDESPPKERSFVYYISDTEIASSHKYYKLVKLPPGTTITIESN